MRTSRKSVTSVRKSSALTLGILALLLVAIVTGGVSAPGKDIASPPLAKTEGPEVQPGIVSVNAPSDANASEETMAREAIARYLGGENVGSAELGLIEQYRTILPAELLEKVDARLASDALARQHHDVNGPLDDCTTPFPEGAESAVVPALPACWVQVNADNASPTWITSTSNPHSGTKTFYISWRAPYINDWLMSPGVALTGGTLYQLKYWRRAAGSYTERLAVWYGSTQDTVSMTNSVAATYTFSGTTYVHDIFAFTPSSSGTYYIGWHGTSLDALGIYMDDIELVAAPTGPDLGVTLLSPCGTMAPNPAQAVSFRISNGGASASAPATAYFSFDNGTTTGSTAVPAINAGSYFDVSFATTVNLTAGAHSVSGWFLPHDTPSANDSAYCTITAQRPCASLTPVDASLDPLPSTPWAGTISSNCGNGGKWDGSFTTVTGRLYHFDLCPDAPGSGSANFDIDIKICNSAGTILAGQDGACSALGQSYRPNNFTWTATGTGTYYVVLAPYSSYNSHTCSGTASNTFTLQYFEEIPPPPPPNDLCENATPLVVNGAQYCGTTVGATDQCAALPYNEVWHTITLTECTDIAVLYCGTAAGPDLMFSLYNAGCCSGSALQYSSTEYATCPDGDVTVHYNGLSAGTYWLPVGFSNQGNYCVQVIGTACSPGTECSVPYVVSSLPFTETNTTVGRGNNHNPSCAGSSNGAPDVAYHYTPAVHEWVTVSLCGSSFDTRLAIYDASNVVSGAEFYCNDDFCTLQSSIPCANLDAGVTYCIVVDGYGSASGNYTVNLTNCVMPDTVFVDDSWQNQSNVNSFNNQLIWQYSAYNSIPDGIDAVGGSVVYVLPGTYPTGPVNITGPVTVTAYDPLAVRPLITATTDASAWFNVNPGVPASFAHLAFDGTGHLMTTCIQHQGTGSITDCAFSHIADAPASYAGYAVDAYGGPLTVQDCQFSDINRVGVYFNDGINGTIRGNTYTGKGTGDWLDYAFVIGGGSTALIENNIVSACLGVASVDGSTSAGIYCWSDPGVTDITLHGNLVYGNSLGTAVDDALSLAMWSNATLTGNNLSNNADQALWSVSHNLVEATANWWGDVNGPDQMSGLSGLQHPQRRAGINVPRTRTLDDQNDLIGIVHYSPWSATTGTDQDPLSPGWQPDLNILGVSTNGTIQQGIDLAPVGGTINVLPGTYNEAVNVNKFVRIIGAGSGSDPATSTVVTHSAYPTGIFSVGASGASSADPLLFQNLHLALASDYGFAVPSGSYSYIKLDNVHVIGTNPMNCTETEIGINVAGTAGLDYLEVTGCAFDNGHYGWYFKKDDFAAGGSAVAHVTVSNTEFVGNDIRAAYIEKLGFASFTGCTIQDNGQFYSDACSFTAFGGGIDLNLKGQEAYQDIFFTDCGFLNNGRSLREGVGLALKARGTGNDPSYQDYAATLDNVALSNCTFTGNERGVRLGEPGKNNTTPTNVSIDGSVFADNNRLYGGADGSAYGAIVNVSAAPTFSVTGNQLSNTVNAWDITDGHFYDLNCWSDYSSNPGFPGQYSVAGGSNADFNPNVGCGGIGLAVSSSYIGCQTACVGDTLYLTFDGTGYITGQLFIQLAPELDANWAAGNQYQNVLPSANASTNLVFAAARRSAGNQIEINAQWGPPYSTGDASQFMAAIPISNATGTHCQTLTMAAASSNFYDASGPHLNAFLLGSVDVHADCENPAVSLAFTNPAVCTGYNSPTQLEGLMTAAVLRGGIPCNSQLESAYVEVNGNLAQQIPLFSGPLAGDFSNLSFPSAFEAATIFGWFNEGCNALVIHAFDAECSEGTATLEVIRDTNPPSLAVTQNPPALCFSDNPASPNYGGTALDENLDITAALGSSCVAATGMLTVSYGANSYSVPLDVASYPATDAEALALWNALKTWIPGANGEAYTFNVEARDCAGNPALGSFALCVDLSLPSNTLTEFDARPTDEGVWLKWSWNYNATQAVRMEVWRSDHISGDYPGYPFPNPARWQVLSSNVNYPQTYPPAGCSLVLSQDGATGTTAQAFTGLSGKGNSLHNGPGLAYWKDEDASWMDESEDRGVYRYVTFVKDASGNWSQLTGGYTLNINSDRSTNYWLGDFSREVTVSPNPSDGDVFTADLSLLSSVYFTNVPPSPGFFDIGPENAENGIGKGIPTPDGVVNFPDLVPFSFNFGLTGPGTFETEHPNSKPIEGLDEQPVVNVARTGDHLLEVGDVFSVTVSLDGNSENVVKVAEAELEYDPDVLELVEATPGSPEVLDGISFVSAKPIAGLSHSVGIAAAALGETALLSGDATLATIQFRWKADRVPVTELSLSVFRLADGFGTVVTGNSPPVPLAAHGAIPTRFALYQNYPNPFNPTTNIRFDLADGAHVQLVIYNIMGQEVRTLVSSFMAAGAYNLAWDGLDDSGRTAGSGMYFYRISAGPLHDIKKMLLTR